MTPGTIVIINGTSSAGKTSIVKAFQDIMDEPWLHTGIDEYAPHIPAKFTTVTSGPDPVLSDYVTLIYSEPVERIVEETAHGEVVHGMGYLVDVRRGAKGVNLLAAKYRGMAAMAEAGVNLVVDEVIFDPRVLRAAVEALAGSDVLFVGLRLPLEVAEQRERDRGNRGPGGARLFYDRVHAHGIYDLEFDTSQLTPLECAQAIQQGLVEGHPCWAFRELDRRFRETSV